MHCDGLRELGGELVKTNSGNSCQQAFFIFKGPVGGCVTDANRFGNLPEA